MSIWIYPDSSLDQVNVKEKYNTKSCIYCTTSLESPPSKHKTYNTEASSEPGGRDHIDYSDQSVRICPVCGWWTVQLYRSSSYTVRPGMNSHSMSVALGTLRNLDLTDQTIPLEEIRQLLVVKYATRKIVSPSVFESVVCGVYKDLGYDVQATGKTGDGGIDAVLRRSDGASIGVQVKRYDDKIEASQIREFLGALILKGHLKGIFVTTSCFTRGAADTAAAAATKQMPIELVDAERFYAQLGLAQRQKYAWKDEYGAPWRHAKLQSVYYHSDHHRL